MNKNQTSMNKTLSFDFDKEIHEECGVFACYNIPNPASITYYGLHSLQHRGQEASGIAVGNEQEISLIKGAGLTVDVFERKDLDELDAKGKSAIGHVRYATAGGQEYENIQPISCLSSIGPIAVVHNGQIVNDVELKKELEEKGAIFQGTSDSEIILHLILQASGIMEERIAKAARRLEGGFAFCVLHDQSITAVRDPHGLKPMVWTSFQDGYLISSESCAFEVMNLYDAKDVLPGQMITFDRGLVKKSMYAPDQSRHLCSMEYIYFARPDSVMDGLNVHAFRKECGSRLALADKDLKADLVLGVPDSSLSAAMGYAEESGLPLETGLVKNPFVTRSFIQPTQALRDRAVRLKLSPVEDVLKGQRVVMIDDSIVRGTTSRRIVSLLREAGAKEVHVRIASPAMVNPCFYGVDTSTKKELIASGNTTEKICELIGADSLKFMKYEDMEHCAKGQGLCMACFGQEYCTPLYSHQKALEETD